MFRKTHNGNKRHQLQLEEENTTNEIQLNEKNSNEAEISRIKLEIDKRNINKHKGIQINQIEKNYDPIKKEDKREFTVKKVFISESQLKEAKNPDDKKKLLGIKREETEKIKEDNKRGYLNIQKELFSLPENLKAESTLTKNDHMDHLLKLSKAGLIDLPKIKTEGLINKEYLIDDKLAEELDYLKVLKKLGPTYVKGYKNDMSHKEMIKLNNIFENVFVEKDSKRKKLLKEKIIEENRKYEQY